MPPFEQDLERLSERMRHPDHGVPLERKKKPFKPFKATKNSFTGNYT